MRGVLQTGSAAAGGVVGLDLHRLDRPTGSIPNRRPVRLMLIGVMAASLIISAVLPEAFGERGADLRRGLRGDAGRAHRLRRRLHARSPGPAPQLSAHPGLAGRSPGCSGSPAGWRAGRRGSCCGWPRSRSTWSAPSLGYVTPGLGRSTTRDWNISGEHMAERCQLFLIIALGESILVTGATFAELEITGDDAGRVRRRLPGQRRAVVGLLRPQRRGRGGGHRPLGRSGALGPLRLHLPAPADGGRHHRHRRRRRAGHRPPAGARQPGDGGRPCWVVRRSSWPDTRCSRRRCSASGPCLAWRRSSRSGRSSAFVGRDWAPLALATAALVILAGVSVGTRAREHYRAYGSAHERAAD